MAFCINATKGRDFITIISVGDARPPHTAIHVNPVLAVTLRVVTFDDSSLSEPTAIYCMKVM